MKSCYKNNTLTIYKFKFQCSIPPLTKSESDFFNLSAEKYPSVYSPNNKSCTA